MDVTLFEIHLDGAQFGPATIGGESEHGEATATGSTENDSGSTEGSRSVARRALRFAPLLIAFGVAAAYAASRRSGGDGDEGFDAEAVEIEA